MLSGMHRPELSDDDLARAARAARIAAGLHERGAQNEAEAHLSSYFVDQAHRFRALAERLETIRRESDGA